MLRFFTTIAAIALLYPTSASAGEVEIMRKWCDERGGRSEFRLPDGTRVDCELPTQSVEADYSKKWAECVGQAMYYGSVTGKQGVCLLLIGKGNWQAHLRRAKTIGRLGGIAIQEEKLQ